MILDVFFFFFFFVLCGP